MLYTPQVLAVLVRDRQVAIAGDRAAVPRVRSRPVGVLDEAGTVEA